MTARDRRRRAHALAYTLLARALESGFVETERREDETESDQRALTKLLDQMAQSHYNRSDMP